MKNTWTEVQQFRRGKGSRTQPVVLAAPDFVPLSAEQERQAVAALADLLAGWSAKRPAPPEQDRAATRPGSRAEQPPEGGNFAY
ncbi:hypothetical protein [Streptomyces sp. RPT161]|uniref:hypothetical protein n=1 Tax=Streptomyces sp. RPT161 TaxID=3015993 RepID=UPI0022B89902|nr:hypothetical protein [Streptomyces sp. RPT161]